MDNLQISNPTGGMDKDKDYSYLDQNDYTDAKNVRHITRDGHTTGDAEIIYGNEFAWKSYVTADTVSAQNKQVRIAVNATASVSPTIIIRASANGVSYSTAVAFNIVINDINTSIDNLLARLDTEFSTAGFGNAVEVSRQYTNLQFGSIVVLLGNSAVYTGIDYEVVFSLPEAAVTEVVEEAIPITYAGETHCIGSFDLLGDLFSFWTTQRNLPDSRDIISATNATPIVITESAAHGLVDGDEVTIQGVPTNTDANGKWIVNVLTPTTYELVGSAGNGVADITIANVTSQAGTNLCLILGGPAHGYVAGDQVYISGVTGAPSPIPDGFYTVVQVVSAVEFTIDLVFAGTYSAGGTAIRRSSSIHDILGYGMIYVATKDEVTATWTATRLLAAKALNLVTLKQIDCHFEINGGRTEGYFTDDYNPPRVFYYTGAYVLDGAMDRRGEGPGIYEYLTLSTALMLFSIAPSVDTDVSQLQAGGSLQSGNWRYLVRFSTDNVTFSLFSAPSGPVNVFSSNIGDATGIRGDAENTLTPKVNVITITGIPTFYGFIELVGVHYVGGGVESFSIRREVLDGTGQIVMYHYGNETTIANFDNSLLFEQRPDIKTALNIAALDQRLLLGNITAYEHPDLTDWAQQATHIATRATLSTLGSLNPRVGYGEEPLYGEYQDYDNVENFVGHMINETYRFGVRLRYRGTDIYTPAYWVDDVTFTTGASGRRTAGLTDFSLTTLPVPTNPPSNATSCYPYVVYPTFTGFDFGYVLPSGKTIAEEFDQIEFVRAERNPTVLATGMAMLALDTAGTMTTDPACLNQAQVQGYYLTPAAPYAGAGTERQYLYLMMPDTFLGEDIDFQAGDQIVNLGNPTYQILRKTSAIAGAGLNRFDALVAELYGDTVATSATAETVGIDDLVYNAGTTTFTVNGTNYDPAPNSAFNYPSYYVAVDTAITDVNGVLDEGIYYVQYLRPNANQYGDVESTFYYSTRALFDIDSTSTTATTFDVFGGDVFTQKTTYEQIYTSSSDRWGQAVAFYSQNTVNAQMRQMGDDGSNTICLPRGNDPNDTWDIRINETGDYRNLELRAYDAGYNAAYLLNQFAAYDPDASQNADYPTRMAYSEVKPANSLLDNYRVFLPLAYKDLSTSNGELLSMQVIQGELYTWQLRAFMRQFFNARATLQGGDDTQDIILGSTTVFSQDGRVISTRGTKHKWSVIKGRSIAGHDTVYWINTELKNAMKFDAAGTGTISESRKMKAFFANNLRWADLFITPADYFGIHGVWSERYGEVIWTVRANATPYLSEWDVADSGGYSYGTVVKYDSTPLSQQNFEQTGDIYIYKNVGSGSPEPPTDTSVWEKISHDNPRWYNEYTIAYCESRDQWESFRSHKPRIYLRRNDGYLSPRPLANTGYVYEHDQEFVCRWYEITGEYIFTGSATKEADTYTVVGIGTAFTTELQAGWELVSTSGIRYVIREIVSDTEITIDEYRIIDYGLPDQTAEAGAFVSIIGFSGVYYPTQIEDAYITPVINLQANVSKVYDAQQYNTLEVPYRVDFTTNEQISFLETADFKSRENYYYSPVKKESTVTGVNTSNTSRMYGSWMLNKITMRYLVFNRIFNFVTKVRYNRRMFNK